MALCAPGDVDQARGGGDGGTASGDGENSGGAESSDEISGDAPRDANTGAVAALALLRRAMAEAKEIEVAVDIEFVVKVVVEVDGGKERIDSTARGTVCAPRPREATGAPGSDSGDAARGEKAVPVMETAAAATDVVVFNVFVGAAFAAAVVVRGIV
jgi:hypothetical protein